MLHQPAFPDPTDEDEARLAAALVDLKHHLLSAPHAVWYDVLRRCDWELHDELILWMLRQPECDFATAFAAFHLSRPDHFIAMGLRAADLKAPDDCIWAVVLEGWAEGQYRDRPFGIDPTHAGAALDRVVGAHARRRETGCDLVIPEAFLTAPALPPPVLPDVWSPEAEPEIAALYQAAELRVADPERPIRPRRARPVAPKPPPFAPIDPADPASTDPADPSPVGRLFPSWIGARLRGLTLRLAGGLSRCVSRR